MTPLTLRQESYSVTENKAGQQRAVWTSEPAPAEAVVRGLGLTGWEREWQPYFELASGQVLAGPWSQLWLQNAALTLTCVRHADPLFRPFSAFVKRVSIDGVVSLTMGTDLIELGTLLGPWHAPPRLKTGQRLVIELESGEELEQRLPQERLRLEAYGLQAPNLRRARSTSKTKAQGAAAARAAAVELPEELRKSLLGYAAESMGRIDAQAARSMLRKQLSDEEYQKMLATPHRLVDSMVEGGSSPDWAWANMRAVARQASRIPLANAAAEVVLRVAELEWRELRAARGGEVQ